MTLDPHKWLYQPFECGCLLVRRGRYLREAFEITPDYLKDTEVLAREVNFADRGVQLSRMCRALKLWVSLKYFGVAAFRTAVDRCLDLAREAQARIEASDDLELLVPSTLGIVCFRRRFEGIDDEDELARLNAGLVEGLAESDKGHISSTRLRGRYALRMCILNHTSTAGDVGQVLDWIERSPVPFQRRRPWRPTIGIPTCANLPGSGGARLTSPNCGNFRYFGTWTKGSWISSRTRPTRARRRPGTPSCASGTPLASFTSSSMARPRCEPRSDTWPTLGGATTSVSSPPWTGGRASDTRGWPR